MIKPLQKYRSVSIILLFVLLTQACAQVKLDAPPALPTARDIEPISTEERSAPLATSTAQVEIPTATEIDSDPNFIPAQSHDQRSERKSLHPPRT